MHKIFLVPEIVILKLYLFENLSKSRREGGDRLGRHPEFHHTRVLVFTRVYILHIYGLICP